MDSYFDYFVIRDLALKLKVLKLRLLLKYKPYKFTYIEQNEMEEFIINNDYIFDYCLA